MKTLFICRGNIGRSQMAKVIYNTLSKNGDSADCCGTRVNEFEGQKIIDIKSESVEDDIRSMKEIGFDLSNGTRKQITPELLDWADRIIVMAERDTWPEYLELNPKVIVWEIDNPKDTTYEKTCEIRDVIKQKVEEILNK